MKLSLMVTKANMAMMLIISVTAGAFVLLRRDRGYDRFFEDFKGRNWLRNEFSAVHLSSIRVKRGVYSSPMTRPGRSCLEGVV